MTTLGPPVDTFHATLHALQCIGIVPVERGSFTVARCPVCAKPEVLWIHRAMIPAFRCAQGCPHAAVGAALRGVGADPETVARLHEL